MACYDTYRDQLASLYYGHALWVPDPSELYDRVRVGDVGYVKQGHFLRMFNALLPANDDAQEYGVPEGFVPLNMGPFKNIRKLNLFHGDYCSNTVTVDHGDRHQAAGPDEDTSASFRCRSNKGAFLSIPLNGVREDAIRTKAFGSYIRRHCDSWLEFASVNEIEVRLEDIIFVTGCDLTASWAMAVFVNSLDPEISLNARISEAGSARFQWAPTNQPHHNEPNQNVVKSHCVFIRGFRAKRILPFFKTLKAAAEPRPDNPDNEPESSIELLREPAVPDYRDPLIGILNYIAEQHPDQELALAHEDDLKMIEGVEVLTADAVENFLRQNKIPVQSEEGVALLADEDEGVHKEKTSFRARADVDGEQLPLIIHPVLMEYLLKTDIASQPPDFDYGLPTEELLSSAVHPPVHLLVLENDRGLPQNIEVHSSDKRSEIGVTIEDVLKTVNGYLLRPSGQRERHMHIASGTMPFPALPRVGGVSSSNRVNSAPQTQKVRSMKDGEDLPPLPSQRSGAKSFVASLVSTVRKMLPSSQQSSKKPTSTSPQVVEVPLPLNRVRSSPQKVQSMKDSEDLPPSPPPRSRAKSTVASSSRSPNSPTSAERSRASPRRPTMRYPARRTLNSTVRQALPEHFKFRILVIGKSGSGKSSLIKVVFKVDVTAAPERTPGKADIDVEFRPGDNRYLIVHECSGLDSPQDLQTIRNFITHRTDPSRSPSERLHAVWICIPASDAIAGRLGDGVEEILGLRNVPVVVVFTKFDVVVSQVRLDSPSETHERARTRAHTMYEDSCRQLFHKDPRDVPAEIVSESSRFIDLIDNLVVTTDRFITDSRRPSSRSSGQGAKQRVDAVPLAWSAALRVNHDIIIQASIEVGRSRYWSELWFSRDFADQTLRNCVNVIHLDIVEIWNMNDKRRYLSSDIFKAKMSHLVKDLAGSANTTSGSDPTRAGDDYADWVNGVYRGSQENVRCVVGYIVDLTVILDGIFRIAAGDMSPSHAEQVFERHARSRHRDAIHQDIRSFITEALAIRSLAPQKDLTLERTIDLIKQCCVPPSGNS